MIYGAQLMFDGDLARCQYLDETPRTITLSLDSAETVCTACGHALRWLQGKWWADEDGGGGIVCERFAPPAPDAPISLGNPAYGHGPHQAQRLPFAWMSDATIQLQPQDGGATEWVEVSVTLPTGTVKLRVEHVIDEGDGNQLAGPLIVYMTRPGAPGAPPQTGRYTVQ